MEILSQYFQNVAEIVHWSHMTIVELPLPCILFISLFSFGIFIFGNMYNYSTVYSLLGILFLVTCKSGNERPPVVPMWCFKPEFDLLG